MATTLNRGEHRPVIAVLGPGAVGGFLASLMSHCGHRLICIATEPTARLIEKDGIRLESVQFGSILGRPNAKEFLNSDVKLLFVTTKANHLPTALERINVEALSDETVVIPLLNGIEHISHLREKFGLRVVAGALSIEVIRESPTFIRHTSRFSRLTIASDSKVSREKLGSIAEILRDCGLEVIVGGGERQILWQKLVRLCALALTTAATDRKIGDLRGDPKWREVLFSTLTEAAWVAAAEGVEMDPQNVLSQLDSLEPHQGSSLQRDVLSGTESELDAIAGAIIRAGNKHHLLCPMIEALKNHIERRLSGSSSSLRSPPITRENSPSHQ